MLEPAGKPVEQAAEAVPQKQRRRNWLSFSLRSLMILVTLCCLAVGGKLNYDWYRKKWRIAEWVAPLVKDSSDPTHPGGPTQSKLPAAPARVKAKDEVELLKFGILELDTPEERFSALKILVESRREESLPVLRELIPKTRHPEMLAMLLHLVSLHLGPEDVAQMKPLLNSQDTSIRAAAAESIGYIHEPTYGIGDQFRWRAPDALLNTNPPIAISLLIQQRRRFNGFNQRESPSDPAEAAIFSPELRSQLEKIMLEGPTQEERTAAARALVAWPPPEYSLRLAEWGVWIDDHGKLSLARSVLEEIPPFVHRAGNPLASLTRNRYHGVIIITRPIIHLTADRPLAVDMEVAIAGGRPWYVFPRPDDFTVRLDDFSTSKENLEHQQSRLAEFDPKDWPTIQPTSEGYPWIHPLSRSEGASTAMYGSGALITGVGLRWQSLIVSPARADWAKLPEVADSPGYRWWTSLREVPSSWVTSQGETERFLYYDGPTQSKPPLLATLEPAKLMLVTQDLDVSLLGRTAGIRNRQSAERDCLLIDRGEKQIRAIRFRLSSEPHVQETLELAAQTWLVGDDVEKALEQILLERGLTVEEGAGLITSWREKFLQNPGQRLLSFLTSAEYDRMCPLEIRPETTAQARVGIVLTEF